jgi:glycosyltransferase involved in cell wall biosynthesis
MAMVQSPKVLLITNIPTPYRIPLFNELNRQLKNRGVQLKVLFGAFGYARRKWIIDMSECEFDYEVLRPGGINKLLPSSSMWTYKRLLPLLNTEIPDVVIVSGFSVAAIKLWCLSWLKPVNYLVWSGAIDAEGQAPLSFFRNLQRKLLVQRAAGFVAYGTEAREYLVSLGAPPNKTHIAVNTVDTRHFDGQRMPLVDPGCGAPGDTKRILCVGDLIRRKGVDQLLRVIKALSLKRCDIVLDLVGSGPELENLKMLAKELDIEPIVTFEGFKQKSDLPLFFARTACFVFPSRYDIWGLVLVEAMAAGVPCISSIHAAATTDLVEDGVTGFAMDFAETEKVAARLDWILEHPDLSNEIGQNAERFIANNVTLQKSAAGFVRAIHGILGQQLGAFTQFPQLLS